MTPALAPLLLSLSLSGTAAAQTPRFVKKPDADAPARVVEYSRQLLGTKYKLGPLGEGPDGEFDSDPLVRFDEVDCQTFVEEVLALARARDEAGMKEQLRLIRYKDGVISYATRNHFSEADWLPNNAAAGMFKIITREVAGADAATVTKTVSKKAWYAAKTAADLKGPRFEKMSAADKEAVAARWRALGASMPDETVSLDYLPVAKLAAHEDAIPSGTIALLVRTDQAGKPTIVSHMGLFVRSGGALVFRHASSGARVLDLPVPKLLAKYEGASWPLLGFALAEPLEP